MGCIRSMLAAALLAAGCTSDLQERVRDYNEDGIYLLQRGDYRSAGESFQAALALQPADPALLYNIGQCHDRQGDLARAEAYYGQSLQRVPNHVECRHALASVLVRQGRAPEAAGLAQDWLAREPKCAAAYALDGWLWHQNGDLPRAQARLQQALALDPQEHHALVELGLVYEALQRPDRAAALYERALEKNPRQTEVTSRLNQLVSRGAGRPKPD